MDRDTSGSALTSPTPSARRRFAPERNPIDNDRDRTFAAQKIIEHTKLCGWRFWKRPPAPPHSIGTLSVRAVGTDENSRHTGALKLSWKPLGHVL